MMESPTGSTRRHGRNVSRPIVRRSTKGPLDTDGPLGEPATTSSSVVSTPELASPILQDEAQPAAPSPPAPEPAQRAKANLDLEFLQVPNIYHALPTDDVAAPFLESQQQPTQDTSLPVLLQGGHFRRAAYAAANSLLQCAHDDAEQILQLYYTRLACLVLVSRPELAALEAAPLLDLLGRNPTGAKEVLPLIPWELRLLLVRLHSLGATDGGRRGVMGLYALASEVRLNLKRAAAEGEEPARELWAERLRDLGLRVADALVEMGELETANRHLDTLNDVSADEITYRKALLRIRVGDVNSARRCLENMSAGHRKATLETLLRFADGDIEGSEEGWRALSAQSAENALVPNNLAVAMMYAGQISDSQQTLEATLARLPAFPGLLFNLSTIYELATERATDRKAQLAQALVTRTPAPDTGGWEKSTFDFKL